MDYRIHPSDRTTLVNVINRLHDLQLLFRTGEVNQGVRALKAILYPTTLAGNLGEAVIIDKSGQKRLADHISDIIETLETV